MQTIELFAGTKSFSKVAAARGHDTFTVDYDARFDTDICRDILKVSPTELPYKPDILWASPPCTCFSVASIGRYWNKDYSTKDRRADQAIEIVKHTLYLINQVQPRIFIIENPRGMLRKHPVMAGLTRMTVTYCQYGDTRMKPTDLWSNYVLPLKPPCKNGDPCHVSAPRGSRTGTQGIKVARDRSQVPAQLCEDIIRFCEENIGNSILL